MAEGWWPRPLLGGKMMKLIQREKNATGEMEEVNKSKKCFRGGLRRIRKEEKECVGDLQEGGAVVWLQGVIKGTGGLETEGANK